WQDEGRRFRAGMVLPPRVGPGEGVQGGAIRKGTGWPGRQGPHVPRGRLGRQWAEVRGRRPGVDREAEDIAQPPMRKLHELVGQAGSLPAEPWLRGPIEDVPPVMAPVLYAFIQASEDLAEHTAGLTVKQIWARPLGLAPLGFQLRHIAGSVDRLATYL